MIKKTIGYTLIIIILLYQGIDIYNKVGWWALLLLPLCVIVGIVIAFSISWLISD